MNTPIAESEDHLKERHRISESVFCGGDDASSTVMDGEAKQAPSPFFSNKPSVLCIGPEAYEWARRHGGIQLCGYLDPFPRPSSIPPVATLPEEGVFSSWEEAIRASRCDLVFQCVPNYAKNSLAMEEGILRSGIPIATPKLRLRDWRDAETLLEISQTAQVPYFCCEHYHLAPNYQTARKLLSRIGTIQTVLFRCSLPQGLKGFNPWTPSYRHLVLEDLSYHHFSILAFLFGNLVVKDGWCRSRCVAVDGCTRNEVHMMAVMEDGWTLNYSTRWGSRNPYFTSLQGNFCIEGADGFLEVSESKLMLNGEPVSSHELCPVAPGILSSLTSDATIHPMSRLEESIPVTKLIQLGLEWTQDL